MPPVICIYLFFELFSNEFSCCSDCAFCSRISDSLHLEIPMKNIFLIGFMGCGKSTIADTLEKKWNFDRIEMDQ